MRYPSSTIAFAAIFLQATPLSSQDARSSASKVRPITFALPGAQIRDVGICSDAGFVVVGTFVGTVDFNPYGAELKRSAGTRSRGFLSRYASDGKCRWVISLGNATACRITNVAVDAEDSALVWGEFSGTLNPGAESDGQTLKGGSEANFMARYDAKGQLTWAKSLAESLPFAHLDAGHPRRLVLDHDGNVFLAGACRTSPNRAVMIAKCNSSGKLLWVKKEFSDRVSGLQIGPKGCVFAVGNAAISTKPGQPITQWCMRIACFDTAGKNVWSHDIRPSSGRSLWSNDMVVDYKGRPCISALLSGSADFDPGPDTHEVKAQEGLVVARFDRDGHLLSAFAIDGKGFLLPSRSGIAVDGLGDLYISGTFVGQLDLDPEKGTHLIGSPPVPPPFAMFCGVFIAKYTPAGVLDWARSGQVIFKKGGAVRTNFLAGISVDKHARQVLVQGELGNALRFEEGPEVSNQSMTGYQGLILRLDRHGTFK